ncbi:MAG: glycosyltransferase family 2 protein [Patescibacteria group bacterium]|nr:glycosyltransferase family 2 protein [Patescibacteria group bacterium]
MKKAIIIVPTYNEKDNIPILISRLMKVFADIEGWQMEILIVDDTSPDETYLVVKALQKKYDNLHLLINKQKAGLGGAYLKGMAQAFNKLKADVVFEFDADMSHPAEKIPEFLKLIDQGYDFVMGTRYHEGGGVPEDWGLHRKLLSGVGNAIISIVFTNFWVRDWTSGFRAISKKVYESVHPLLHSERFYGYTFQIGFLYNTLKKGYKVGFVPYKFTDRTHGKSKIGPEYIKNNLIYIFKMRIKDIIEHRLFKFAVVGLVGAMVQFVTLALMRNAMYFTLAYFLSAELAVSSNFILSNIWTFSDRKLKLVQVPLKFLTFNVASFGSVGIQTVLAEVGARTIGTDVYLFTVPLSKLVMGRPFIFDTGFSFMIIGILVGMVWNYLAYTKVIWQDQKKQ